MRICLVAIGVAVVASAHVASADEHVKLEDVPPAVRTTIEREAQGGKIEEIERETKNGNVVYEVEIERGKEEVKLYIDQAGNVIKAKRD